VTLGSPGLRERLSRDWFDGHPKNAWFFSLSGTSVVEPSIETTRSPQHSPVADCGAGDGPMVSSSAVALVESDEHEIRIDAGVISAVGDVDVAPPDENSGGILGAVCRISQRRY
jgi:hypothetical protein